MIKLTSEKIEKEACRVGHLEYEIMARFNNENIYDLDLKIDSIYYCVASYQIKQEKLILICPNIIIPATNILREFTDSCIKLYNKKDKK